MLIWGSIWHWVVEFEVDATGVKYICYLQCQRKGGKEGIKVLIRKNSDEYILSFSLHECIVGQGRKEEGQCVSDWSQWDQWPESAGVFCSSICSSLKWLECDSVHQYTAREDLDGVVWKKKRTFQRGPLIIFQNLRLWALTSLQSANIQAQEMMTLERNGCCYIYKWTYYQITF